MDCASSIRALFELRGRKALITGAAAGIGRSCAIALAAAGADVAIVDRDRVAGTQVVRDIEALGRKSLFV